MPDLIYVIEDDENIRELVKMALSAFSFEVETFADAESALDACHKRLPSLAIFDIMLPGISGIDAVKRLRARPQSENLPIILLTAKGTEAEKVTGLDAGADDYITKPFGVLELSSRVKALLRRARRGEESAPQQLSASDLVMNLQTREVRQGGQLIELTLKEFELLRALMQENGKVVTREHLLNTVWGYDYLGETRTLDMHIRTLRQKLSDSTDNPRYIKTVRGVGYRFAE